MTRDLTVYTAACWWRDCDAHTYVIATTADAAEKAIFEAMRDAADYANNDEWCVCGVEVTDETASDHEDCAMDAQRWSGVHPESLREVFRNTINDYARRDIKDDLRASGVAYGETF